MEDTRYLGYTVGRGLVKRQMNKVEAIQAYSCHVAKKQAEAFLGINGYCHRFVLHFATISAPLTNFTKGKKSVIVKWNDKAGDAFLELKTTLCKYSVLVAPDVPKEFVIQMDSSSGGLGTVLSQKVNGEEHFIVFLSRNLADAERNYTVVERIRKLGKCSRTPQWYINKNVFIVM